MAQEENLNKKNEAIDPIKYNPRVRSFRYYESNDRSGGSGWINFPFPVAELILNVIAGIIDFTDYFSESRKEEVNIKNLLKGIVLDILKLIFWIAVIIGMIILIIFTVVMIVNYSMGEKLL